MSFVETAPPGDAVGRAMRPVLILARTLLASLIGYLALVELIRSRFRPFLGFADLGRRLSVRYVFYLAAAAAVIVIRVLNSVGLRRKKPSSPESLLGRLRTVAWLTLAAAETPALAGLALFLVGGYNEDFYWLKFVSLLLLFMYFPRPKNWEAHLRNAPRACPF